MMIIMVMMTPTADAPELKCSVLGDAGVMTLFFSKIGTEAECSIMFSSSAIKGKSAMIDVGGWVLWRRDLDCSRMFWWCTSLRCNTRGSLASSDWLWWFTR